MIAVTGRTRPRTCFYAGKVSDGVWRVQWKPQNGSRVIEGEILDRWMREALDTCYQYDRPDPTLEGRGLSHAQMQAEVVLRTLTFATRSIVKNPRPDAKPDGGSHTSEPEGPPEDSSLPDGVQPFPACPTCKDPSEVYLHEDGRYFVCGQCGRSFVDDPALHHRCAECDYRVEPLGRKGRCSSCGGVG